MEAAAIKKPEARSTRGPKSTGSSKSGISATNTKTRPDDQPVQLPNGKYEYGSKAKVPVFITHSFLVS